MKDPQLGMASNKPQKGLLPGMTSSEQQRQGRLDSVRCKRTKHTTPQALAGVRVVASLLGHSRLEALCSHAITQVGQYDVDLGKVG